jgi:hypothetical protein
MTSIGWFNFDVYMVCTSVYGFSVLCPPPFVLLNLDSGVSIATFLIDGEVVDSARFLLLGCYNLLYIVV